jgi:hypothetical protein
MLTSKMEATLTPLNTGTEASFDDRVLRNMKLLSFYFLKL